MLHAMRSLTLHGNKWVVQGVCVCMGRMLGPQSTKRHSVHAKLTCYKVQDFPTLLRLLRERPLQSGSRRPARRCPGVERKGIAAACLRALIAVQAYHRCFANQFRGFWLNP